MIDIFGEKKIGNILPLTNDTYIDRSRQKWGMGRRGSELKSKVGGMQHHYHYQVKLIIFVCCNMEIRRIRIIIRRRLQHGIVFINLGSLFLQLNT